MLWWAIVFFIVAVVAAIFGFGALAGTAATIAQVIFYAALIFFVLSFIFNIFRGGQRSPA